MLKGEEKAKAASFYAEVTYVPPGFTYQPAEATITCGLSVRDLKWHFPGADDLYVEIGRGLPALPFDIRIAPEDSWYTVEEGRVREFPAIFERNQPGQGGSQAVYFADGDVLTIVSGQVSDFSDLIKVAESIR